jgi:hypothetical protein
MLTKVGFEVLAADGFNVLRALLNGGVSDGACILKSETVAIMGRNHMASSVQRRS